MSGGAAKIDGHRSKVGKSTWGDSEHTDRDLQSIRALHSALLSWFSRAKRDLPWRRTQDPYAVWLSEVMLQQTQVSTVIPYWERFLDRFPTVDSLAAAPVEDVLALWTGLGYYARGRNLHRAAQRIVEEHGGRLPADLNALKDLPGFGPYTAGAVASIALGLKAPIVDGNVARVFCRLEGWELGSDEARAKAWHLAPVLLPARQCGDWNQALMELGSTVCTPRNPRCDECPVATLCRGALRGDPALYPLPKVRPKKKLLRLSVLALRDGEGRVLLRKRKARGLFGGLWELPGQELDEVEGATDAAAELAGDLMVGTVRIERLGQVSRTLTHRLVEAEVFGVTGGRLRKGVDASWVAPSDFATMGLSTFALKTLEVANVPVPPRPSRTGSRR